MKKFLFLLLLPPLTFADPAVRNVQVNIHNHTPHTLEFKNFDSSRIFASTRFGEEEVLGYSSVHNAIFFTSFDKETINAGVEVMINDKPMKLMWQINMGYDDEDNKFHICGVIKDNEAGINQEHCDMPYVESGTLMIDFNIL